MQAANNDWQRLVELPDCFQNRGYMDCLTGICWTFQSGRILVEYCGSTGGMWWLVVMAAVLVVVAVEAAVAVAVVVVVLVVQDERLT